MSGGGLSLALSRRELVLSRFPAARPSKTCDSVPLEMLLPPPTPPSLALMTRQTEIVLVSPKLFCRATLPHSQQLRDKSSRAENRAFVRPACQPPRVDPESYRLTDRFWLLFTDRSHPLPLDSNFPLVSRRSHPPALNEIVVGCCLPVVHLETNAIRNRGILWERRRA